MKISSGKIEGTSDFPSLAIIIVNWGGYSVTKNCLESLREIEYKNYSVVLVDNNSEDSSGEKLNKEFSEVIYLKNETNLGFTGGNNTGIRYAIDKGYTLVMLLNNDTVVTEDFASLLVESFMSEDSVGAIQPKIRFNRERDIIWNAGSFFNDFWATSKPRGLNEKDIGQYDQSSYVPWITGCCFLTSTEIIKKIGLLDQKFFCYYEDTDWSFKITKLGLKLKYEPKSLIFHEVGMSNQNSNDVKEGNLSPFTHYVTVRNHIFLIKRYSKNINVFGAWTNQFFKLTGYVGYFLIRRRFTKLRAVLRGFRDGITG